MTPEELDAIEQRADAATPGPWVDIARVYWDAMQTYRRTAGRWWHNDSRDSHPISLIVQNRCPHPRSARWDGSDFHPITAACIPSHMDWYDLQKVLEVRWSDFPKRVTEVINKGLYKKADKEFVLHAREDVPALVAAIRERDAELERLRAENERLRGEREGGQA